MSLASLLLLTSKQQRHPLSAYNDAVVQRSVT